MGDFVAGRGHQSFAWDPRRRQPPPKLSQSPTQTPLADDNGAGVVIKIDGSDERGKPVVVQFSNDEVHHYSTASANKLFHASAVQYAHKHCFTRVCV